LEGNIAASLGFDLGAYLKANGRGCGQLACQVFDCSTQAFDLAGVQMSRLFKLGYALLRCADVMQQRVEIGLGR